MRSRPAVRLGGLLLAFSGAALSAAAQDAAPAESGWDAALRWEGGRHGTLGPTGRRLFAGHLEQAPGITGRFHYGAGDVQLLDPIRIEVVRDGARLTLEHLGTTWFPSRLEQRWQAGDLLLEETELVTDGDLLVDELRLTNAGAGPLDVVLHARGGATPRRDRSRSRVVPVDLSGAANLAPAGGTPLFTDQAAPRAVWVEAEAFEAAVERIPGPSAGGYVAGFGERAGTRHLLVATAPPLDRPTLLLRYLSGPEPTRIAVELDGDPAGELALPAGAGWRFARLSLDELPAGRVLIALVALEAAPVLLDGVFLAEQDFEPGPLPEGGAWQARVPEQLELFGGVREVDGVRYAFPAGAEVRRSRVVGLRGGLGGDRARDLPERVDVALPDLTPARTTLHLLVRCETPRGRRTVGTRPPTITLRLDDGSAETIPWPEPGAARGALPASLGERVELTAVEVPGLDEGTVQLSYDPPPGRAATQVELRAGEGPEVPVLLAATMEVPGETGRLPVLVGSATLEAQPVELTLALSDAVPARTTAGERSLSVLVSLAPGESRSLRAVLAAGPRRPQCLLQALEAVVDEELVERHRATFAAWFGQAVPAFTCSDPWLEQAWRHRWTVVRRNLLRLDLPDFSLPVAYEGTCCAQHARVTPRAAAFALRELRWLRDPTPAQGTLRALLKRQRGDGLLFGVAPGPPRWEETYVAHDLAAAAIGVWEVSGSRQYLEEVLALLQRDLEGALAHLDADGDEILGPFLVADEAATGTSDRPLFRLADLRWGPVEPVELGSLLAASARALAVGRSALGDTQEARRLDALAAQLTERVETRCWDEEAAWFLSLDASGARLRVREIAGLLPLASGLGSEVWSHALATLLEADAFWAPYPVRSVARTDQVGGTPRDPTGWNGPVHLEGLTWAVDAAARAARQQRDEVSRERLRRLLDAATRLVFEDGALERPVTREAWDPDTGRGAGCVDGLRSAYADLLVRHVAGVVPRADGVLELDPLAFDLEHFRFAGLPHRGRLVEVTWDRPDGVRRFEALDLPEGFTVVIDGVRRHHAAALGPVILDDRAEYGGGGR